MSAFEELREALLNLEESRKREAHQRQMAESLLAGLRALVMTDDSDELFSSLFEIMRKAVAFETAFVLVENRDGSLTPLASSDPGFMYTVWHPKGMLKRVMGGQTVSVFDTRLVEEWKAQSAAIPQAVRSALHFPIHTAKRKAIFVCTHSGRAHFTRDHVLLARRFSVLATQALQKMESEERMADLEKRLAAEARLAELNWKLADSEKRLARAQKMEAIGTLAGGIAHEFNNILGIMLGNIELAMMDVPESNPAHFNLREVQSATLRAKEVVRQILSFSRHSEHELKPVKISDIVGESINFLRSSLPSSIEIRREIRTGIDTVLADSTQIHQVLINLCTNATHAMRDNGGILSITLEHIALDETDAARYPSLYPGDHVKLSISDTGHGIKKEIMDRIFDPYFTTKRVGDGTGMGLAVVHGIVTNHGGVITVSSEPEKGALFTILLPVVMEPVVSEEKKVDSHPVGNERILFVDDEMSIVMVGKQMIERLGYEVITRTSSVEALELFKIKSDQFDLIITDMTMPNLTGDRLAEAILKIRTDIPIILCTGYSDRISEQKAREMGIQAFVLKPLDIGGVAHTIRNVLDGRTS
jgi:signal transduction histidine kinase/CheY-like chemotaxis protein